MQLEINQNGDVLECVFQGRLDASSCEGIGAGLIPRVEQHDGKVVFEMKDVTFIASAFLRLCTMTARAVGDENFAIKNVSVELKKIFKMVGFDTVMDIS